MIVCKLFDGIRHVESQYRNSRTYDILSVFCIASMTAYFDPFFFPVLIAQDNYLNHTKLSVDLVNLNLGIKLSVAVFLMIASFALILVNDNFFALANLLNGCGNSRVFHCGASDRKLAVVYSQNLIKSNNRTYFCVQSLNLDAVAFGYFILLTTCCNNRVHIAPPIIITRQLRCVPAGTLADLAVRHTVI